MEIDGRWLLSGMAEPVGITAEVMMGPPFIAGSAGRALIEALAARRKRMEVVTRGIPSSLIFLLVNSRKVGDFFI